MNDQECSIDLEQILRDRFGLERFRPGQREVIERVLERRDVLCVMPTGGGKSLCYQLPALVLDGLTLVVSPLIALMKDQVDALVERNLPATFLNSTLDPAEQQTRIREIESGRFRLVYVAPERFRSGRFIEAMARIRPALLAVDEAHCISEWGHDFRPDYARIGQARRALGMPPCIALTATATDLVRRDVADQLDLKDHAQFVTGFDRPNLTYGVVKARRHEDKFKALAGALERDPGPAIVYASSRRRCEEIGEYLEKILRRSAVVYHAGMQRDERTLAQNRFMSGEAEVVVATNAFGMGIDKADVRHVVHFNMPGTLEAYYQEAGRAGRDGSPSHCVLIYSPGDRFLQEVFIENEYPPREAVYRIYEHLRRLDADPIELTQAEIKESVGLDLSEQTVGTALRILEGAGGLERFRPRENMAIVRFRTDQEEPSLVDRIGPQAHVQRMVLLGLEGLVNRRLGEPVYFQPDELAAAVGLDRTAFGRAIRHLTAELPIDYIPPFRGNALRILDRSRPASRLEIDFTDLDKRKKQEYEKLEIMIKYAQSSNCRRSYILGYFGDAERSECGRCDNCGEGSDGGGQEGAGRIETQAGREVLLKVLSGVARTKGRFGKNVVAQMLMGSGSEKMTRWGLTSLSTFGVLKAAGFTQAEVVLLVDALITAGLVGYEEVDRFKDVVVLSEKGWEWLRGQGPAAVSLELPEPLLAKVRNGGLERIILPPPLSRQGPDVNAPLLQPSSGVENEVESGPSSLDGDPLWEQLKALRSQWARELKQPAYCIFWDKTLEAICAERPRTPLGLSKIKGMGPAKLERYGAALLEAVSASADAPNPGLLDQVKLPEAPPSSDRRQSAVETQPAYLPTEEWTWRLLDKGFTIDDAAAIRGLERSAIIRHATWSARRGKTVPLASFLSEDQRERWATWRSRRGDDQPPPESEATEGLWGLFLACQTASSAP